jgi:predicted small metal-binding protein
VIRGKTEEEVMDAATRHNKEIHGQEADPEMARNMRGLIREE